MERFALTVKNVTKTFGSVQALSDVSFDLKVGEIHCLAGENGCGKSTLIKIITGVYSVDPGACFSFAEGTETAHVSTLDSKRHGIHVIWQDLALFPHLTVAENIVFDDFVGRPFHLLDQKRSRLLARQALDRLNVVLDVDAMVCNLTIAQRQIVAICRAIRTDARIVFMDEPTASLTKRETDLLLDVVRKMSADEIAVVFISHRLTEVLDIAERVTVLRDGKRVGCFPAKGLTPEKLSFLMTGQEIPHTLRPPLDDAPPILEVKHLSRQGEFEDISFTLHRGEVLGLAGLLGSGRTELAMSLFGLTVPDSGKIRIEGKAVSFRSNRDAIDKGIAYVSEDRLNLGLVQQQSIEKNIALTVLERIAGAMGYVRPSRLRNLSIDWISRLKIKATDSANAVNTLSGGNQQRVVLAKWLAIEPKVLLLDCPTVGVDVGARTGIFEIIHKLADTGMSILLISDEALELYYNSNRILMIRAGRLVGELIPSQTSAETLERAINA